MTVTQTSREAYKYAIKTLNKRQMQVFSIIKSHGPITNYKISKILNMSINSITPRTKELRDKGLVCREGTIIEVTKRRSIIWKAKD